MKKLKKVGFALIFVAVLALAILAVMLLWNALIPSIIGWTTISYLQAAGLMLLCKILFGGFGHHFHRFGRGRCHSHSHRHNHREFKDMHEKMKGMSRDDRREYVRERMMRGFHEGESPKHED